MKIKTTNRILPIVLNSTNMKQLAPTPSPLSPHSSGWFFFFNLLQFSSFSTTYSTYHCTNSIQWLIFFSTCLL